jgi:hypothetical protein
MQNIYYHINSYKKYKVGDVIEIGNDYNLMAKNLFATKYFNNKNEDANMIMINMFMNKQLEFANVTDLNIVRKTVNHEAFISRELIFEYVRKEKYPYLPSRLKCLYLSKDKYNLEEWESIFQRMDRKPLQLLQLELDGTIFEGNVSYILKQNNSLNDKLEQANKYWSGDKEKMIPEILFVGKAKVIGIIKEYN